MRLHGTNLIRDSSNNYVSNHYSAGNGDCDTKNAGKYNGDTILGMCLHFTLRPRTHGCAIFPVGYGTYYLYHTHHLDNGNIRGTIIQSPQPPRPPPPPRRTSGVFGGGGGGGGGRRLSEQQPNVTFADHYLEPTRYVWRCSYNMGDATIPEYYKHPYKDLVRNPEWQKGLNYSELWILPHQHPENLLADTLAYQRTQHHERTRVLAQQMKQRQQPVEYAREHEHEDILEIRSKNTEHREATRRFLEARKQTPQQPSRSKRRAHDDFARFSTSPGDVRGSEIQPTQMAMFVLDLDATGTHDLVIHSPAPSDGSCSMRCHQQGVRRPPAQPGVGRVCVPTVYHVCIRRGLATIRLKSTPKTPTGRFSPRRCATAGTTAKLPPQSPTPTDVHHHPPYGGHRPKLDHMKAPEPPPRPPATPPTPPSPPPRPTPPPPPYATRLEPQTPHPSVIGRESGREELILQSPLGTTQGRAFVLFHRERRATCGSAPARRGKSLASGAPRAACACHAREQNASGPTR